MKCIAIDPQMQNEFPEMYSYIMGWARGNDLVVNESECAIDGSTAQCTPIDAGTETLTP